MFMLTIMPATTDMKTHKDTKTSLQLLLISKPAFSVLKCSGTVKYKMTVIRRINSLLRNEKATFANTFQTICRGVRISLDLLSACTLSARKQAFSWSKLSSMKLTTACNQKQCNVKNNSEKTVNKFQI